MKTNTKTVYKLKKMHGIGILWFLVLREGEKNTCVILLNEFDTYLQ